MSLCLGLNVYVTIEQNLQQVESQTMLIWMSLVMSRQIIVDRAKTNGLGCDLKKDVQWRYNKFMAKSERVTESVSN